jgi:hypothetical protein
MSVRLHTFGRTYKLAVGTAIVLLGAALVPAAAEAATTPAPTQIHASVTSSLTPPCSAGTTCGDPGVLIVQNTPFTLDVSLTDDTGADASFNKDTNLTVSATGPGAVTPTTVTMPGGSSSAQFPISYSTYANAVTITVGSTIRGKTAPAPGTTAPFTVLQTLHVYSAPNGQPFQQGAGDNGCADVSAANPVCGILVLPNGANTDVLLSTGSCVNIGCNTKGTVTQFIGDISNLGYSKTNPATLIIECYRTVCGKGGVHQLTGVAADSQQTGALVTAPPCPAKNTIGADQNFCTDQVQNNRLNADDSLVYILFADDFRGAI